MCVTPPLGTRGPAWAVSGKREREGGREGGGERERGKGEERERERERGREGEREKGREGERERGLTHAYTHTRKDAHTLNFWRARVRRWSVGRVGGTSSGSGCGGSRARIGEVELAVSEGVMGD